MSNSALRSLALLALKPELHKMKHGSLFSGIGGFDLAAQSVGWENVFHCELNPFGQKILKYYWPTAISYADIKETDFTIHRGTIDIITGGFPCQPYSAAGKRLGKEDDRHLWPEMLRAIREIQPTWIVGENVRGLTNWNGGMVFDEVQADLENEGYEVTPFLLPACAINAPHRRDRIWFVAYSSSYGHKSGRLGKDRPAQTKSIEQQEERERLWSDIGGISEQVFITDTGLLRQKERKEQATRIEQRNKEVDANTNGKRLRGQSNGLGNAGQFGKNSTGDYWQNFPTQSPICSGDDGLPTELDSITFSKWRNESIKGYGNAIVPPLAMQIFQSINQYVQHDNA
jgi:DNA (cytosine-5)-methyltransferase 1